MSLPPFAVRGWVDKVRLYTIIKMNTDTFNKKSFKLIIYVNKKSGEVKDYYLYNFKGVKIAYFIDSNIFSVQGKLINLSHKPNKVNNLDYLWSGDVGSVSIEKEIKPDKPFAEEPSCDIDDNLVFIYNEPTYMTIKEDYEEDLNIVIEDLNRVIEDLTEVKLDVRNFSISYIEICFNVHTTYVGEYLKLFNEIFKERNLQRYKNYTIETNKSLDTSFYIQTRSDYKNKDKPKTNYTVNFYNKLDQLNDGIEKNKQKLKVERSNITNYDLQLAENILRLEVQCKYHYLRGLCDRFGISRTFGNFINIDLCGTIIKEKYSFFIDKSTYAKFMNYKTMQNEIKHSMLLEKDKLFLIKYISKYSMGHSIGVSSLRKYKKLLSEIGLHYHFIPTKWDIDTLESPMNLLDEEILKAKQTRVQFLIDICGYSPEQAEVIMENGEIESKNVQSSLEDIDISDDDIWLDEIFNSKIEQ